MPLSLDIIPQNPLISASGRAFGRPSSNLLSLTHNGTKCVLSPQEEQKEEKKKKRKNGCPNSRYMFVRSVGGGKDAPTAGKVELCAAPCKANSCPYCGRKKAWAYVHKVEELLAADQAAGRSMLDLFITFTLRGGIAPKPDLFRAIKKGHKAAIKAARTGKKGKKKGGGRGIAFPALSLAYANSMDVQENGTVHIHSLYRLTPQDFRKLPGKSDRAKCKSLARFMWWYYSSGIYLALGLTAPVDGHGRKRFTGSDSPGFVHVVQSSGAVNAAQYMALHNGKAWKQRELGPGDLPPPHARQEVAHQTHPDLPVVGNAWPYPHRYRLLTTSRRFFPAAEPRDPSEWVFVREPMSFVCSRLAEAGVSMVVDKLGKDGETVVSLTAELSWASDVAGKWITGGRRLKRWEVKLKDDDPEASDEWNNAENMKVSRGEVQFEKVKKQVRRDQAAAESEGVLYWQYRASELERRWHEAERLGLTESEYSAWLAGVDAI